MLNENSFILGLEIFKKYYYPEIVINKKQSQFINEIDKLAKKLGYKGAGITLANKIYLLAQKRFLHVLIIDLHTYQQLVVQIP